MERLILFDIDGTLLRTHNGYVPFNEAILKTFGIEGDIRTVIPDGKTDPKIVQEIFAKSDISVEFTAMHWQQFALHLQNAYAEATRAQITTIRALPGVLDLVANLGRLGVYGQGVVTGNLEASAAIKLGAAGLLEYISFGAYGSDSAHRPDLPSIALQRWKKTSNRYIGNAHCVIVGDTPWDLDAARHNGMRCILVGTGRYPVEELLLLNPDACLPDLTDTDEVIKVLRAV